MGKLEEGVQRFHREVYGPQREKFDRLVAGQNPMALFITCSDSRIDPNLLTQTQPGELFVLRNAGNLVPAHGTSAGGEAATIEFAVQALGVRDIVVCGHTQCGAMRGLLAPDSLRDLPAVAGWLRHAQAVRHLVMREATGTAAAEDLQRAAEQNVLVQLQNLRTHPAVAAGLARGHVRLHGWVYQLETGAVVAFDPIEHCFAPLTGQRATGSS